MLFFVSCASKQQNKPMDTLSQRTISSDSIADTIQVDSILFETSEVDAPIGLSEIEKYENRVALQHISNLPVTHPDAYKIRTQQSTYSTKTDKIQLDVMNIDAPVAEPEYHRLEQWKQGKWVEFPFIDNLSFAGVGRDLVKGGILPDIINMSEFKNPLKPNKYKVHFFVYANIYTYCTLTDNAIVPVTDSALKGAFEFRVLKSANDSIRVLFANHTNLRVQPTFFPSVGTEELYSVHPLARSGGSGEHKWMEEHASVPAGEGVVFSIPVSWEVSRLHKSPDNERYMSGKLAPGTYKLGLGIEVYITTEFEVD